MLMWSVMLVSSVSVSQDWLGLQCQVLETDSRHLEWFGQLPGADSSYLSLFLPAHCLFCKCLKGTIQLCDQSVGSFLGLRLLWALLEEQQEQHWFSIKLVGTTWLMWLLRMAVRYGRDGLWNIFYRSCCLSAGDSGESGSTSCQSCPDSTGCWEDGVSQEGRHFICVVPVIIGWCGHSLCFSLSSTCWPIIVQLVWSLWRH